MRRWRGSAFAALLAVVAACGGGRASKGEGGPDAIARDSGAEGAAGDLAADEPLPPPDASPIDSGDGAAADAAPPPADVTSRPDVTDAGAGEAPPPPQDGAAPLDVSPDVGAPGDVAAAADGADVAAGGGERCGPVGILLGGPARLLDAFPVPEGIVVVRSDALVLMDRKGVSLKTVMAPREITAASFDGARLAVADRAVLGVWGTALEPRGQVDLIETCAASVMADGLFVCGPRNDWDRIFYTFRVDTPVPSLAGRSPFGFTYEGLGMRGIPGRLYFLTSGGTLFRFTATGDTRAVVGAPRRALGAGVAIAFWGRPATHLIDYLGQMYRLFGAGCDGETTGPAGGCLVKDGVLGTLASGESFEAMTEDQAGRLVCGLVRTGVPNGFRAECVDVARREVVARKPHRLELGASVSSRLDPECNRLLVVYRKPGSSPFGDTGDHFLASLDY